MYEPFRPNNIGYFLEKNHVKEKLFDVNLIKKNKKKLMFFFFLSDCTV